MSLHTPAGPLRHVVKIQQPSASTCDAMGAPTPSGYTDLYAAVRAEIRPLRGDQYLAGQQLASVVDYKIRIRYHSGIRPGYRVVFGARYFKVVSVIDPEMRKIYLDLMSKEIQEGAS